MKNVNAKGRFEDVLGLLGLLWGVFGGGLWGRLGNFFWTLFHDKTHMFLPEKCKCKEVL